MLRNAFFQALREIRRNLMRSLLTAIGIVIGIASVIAMVNIGKGASKSITQSVEKLGSNTLYIMPGQQRGPGNRGAIEIPFKKKDLETLRSSLYTLRAISPVENALMTIIYKDQNYRTNIRGVENDYLIAQNWNLQEGRVFDKSELRTGQNVCIVGQTVVKTLFAPSESIVGKRIRLKNFSCEVIGVLETKGANTFGSDQDDMLLVPFSLFQRRISGSDNIHLMIAAVKENIPLVEAKVQIEQLLRERRRIDSADEDNFSVRSMTALIDTISEVTTILTIMLGAVAAISLIVGGIGIMNIMLVSVTERTREIGIRMAVGAMAKDILIQFLIESIVLSGLGGVVGIVLGVAITFGVTLWLDIALVINPTITMVALFFSMLIGIVFGIIPARKAANMNPIDALRYE
ncbi:MAG TPA: multidrug ABC transporter substrate-binding protein [Sulfurovum sp. UBA12169]|nr:MAG TPA: multidrug ABC transporter substrate-binding protein [Sulfurovum sp. UBA12169]